MDYQLIADAWLSENREVLDTLSAAELRAVGLIASGVPDERALDAVPAEFVRGMKGTSLVRQTGTTIELAQKTRENTLSWVFSDEKPDRAGDIILQNGWKLENYKRNPVILWGHAGGFDSEADIPIGRAENVRVEGTKLVGDIVFAVGESDRAARIYRLAAAGYVKAGSVGFRPLKVNQIADEAERSKLGLGRYGVVFEKQELLEFSLCAVPCNPGALQLSLKGGAIREEDAEFARSLTAATERDEVSALRRRARAFLDSITKEERPVEAATPSDIAAALREIAASQKDQAAAMRELISSREDDSASRRMLARALTDLGARLGAIRAVDSARQVVDAPRESEPVDLGPQLEKLNHLLAGLSGGKN